MKSSVESLRQQRELVFQNILGDTNNEKLLLSFLNSILDDDQKVRTISYSSVPIQPGRPSRIDVRARTLSGEEVIIALFLHHVDMGDVLLRAQFCLADMACVEGAPNITAVLILGTNVTECIGAVNEARLTFKAVNSDKAQTKDNARVIFVELEKFDPNEASSNKTQHDWLSFLKEPKSLSENSVQSDEVKNAIKIFESIQ